MYAHHFLFLRVLAVFTLLFVGKTQAQNFAMPRDTSLVAFAKVKTSVFMQLLTKMGSNYVSLSDKKKISDMLLNEVFDATELRITSDLSYPTFPSVKVSAMNYLRNMQIQYPEGVKITYGAPEYSPVIYNEAKNYYFIKMKVKRTLFGSNKLENREIALDNTIEIQVKIMQGTQVRVRVVGYTLHEGNFDSPGDFNKKMNEEPPIIPEQKAIFKVEERNLYAILDELEAIKDRELFASNPANMQADKVRGKAQRMDAENQLMQAQLEKERLALELKAARATKASLFPTRLNLKLGAGTFLTDQSLVDLLNAPQWRQRIHNRYIKIEGGIRFAGVKKEYDGDWSNGHVAGIYLTGGQISGLGVAKILSEKGKDNYDPTFHRNRFFEFEIGVSLKENLRLSGGIGTLRYQDSEINGSGRQRITYPVVTIGLAPRIFDVVEFDITTGFMFINGGTYPRVAVGMSVLLQTLRAW